MVVLQATMKYWLSITPAHPPNSLNHHPTNKHSRSSPHIPKSSHVGDALLGGVVQLLLRGEAPDAEADGGVREVLVSTDGAKHVRRLQRCGRARAAEVPRFRKAELDIGKATPGLDFRFWLLKFWVGLPCFSKKVVLQTTMEYWSSITPAFAKKGRRS
jgi:hypothetical protein